MRDFQPNLCGKQQEGEKIKVIGLFRSDTTRSRKYQKKKAKKIKKNPIMASFQAKIVWKRQRKRENKNYNFVPSLPDT